MSIPTSLSRCPGCGLRLPELDAPTPADVGASPACWALYGRLLVAEYGQAPSPRLHQLTVDSYGAQHPTARQDGTDRSLGFHLIGLCLLLERGVSAQQTSELLAQIVERPPSFDRLERQVTSGAKDALTVSDILAARTPDEHARLVEQWAGGVWGTWAPHHGAVRAWLDGSRSGRVPPPPRDADVVAQE